MTYSVLEGPKGSGKSTVLAAVRTGLRAHGVAFAEVHPTRPGARFHPLEVLGRLPLLGRVDVLRERLYAYRSNHHAARVEAWGPLVLGDRSVLTSLATRWERAERLGAEAHVRAVRRLEHRLPLPDHVFYLDVPVDELLARLEVRRPQRRYGRDHETRAHLEKDRRAYAALEQRPPAGFEGIRWHRLDARRPPEAVARDIVATILDILEVPHALAS
jgi:thymidylate kinase